MDGVPGVTQVSPSGAYVHSIPHVYTYYTNPDGSTPSRPAAISPIASLPRISTGSTGITRTPVPITTTLYVAH